MSILDTNDSYLKLSQLSPPSKALHVIRNFVIKKKLLVILGGIPIGYQERKKLKKMFGPCHSKNVEVVSITIFKKLINLLHYVRLLIP